jgi:hypothetical protein
MNTLITEILTADPDAKPLRDSLTARWLVVMAAGWAAQNLGAWLALDQSTTATLATGLLGLVSFLGALVGVMRRAGIRVPDWLHDLLSAATREPPAP